MNEEICCGQQNRAMEDMQTALMTSNAARWRTVLQGSNFTCTMSVDCPLQNPPLLANSAVSIRPITDRPLRQINMCWSYENTVHLLESANWTPVSKTGHLPPIQGEGGITVGYAHAYCHMSKGRHEQLKSTNIYFTGKNFPLTKQDCSVLCTTRLLSPHLPFRSDILTDVNANGIYVAVPPSG
jgi:hypothetical protein